MISERATLLNHPSLRCLAAHLFVTLLAVPTWAQYDPDPGGYDTCDQSAVLFPAFANDDSGVSAEIHTRPDADLAVGACHLIAVSNFGIKGFAKSSLPGSLSKRLTKQPLTSPQDVVWEPLFQGPYGLAHHSKGVDPRAIYDSSTGRYFFVILLQERYDDVTPPSIFQSNRFGFGLAVSKSSDPNPVPGNSGWHIYRVDLTADLPVVHNFALDQPNLSVDSDYLYIHANSAFGYWHIARIPKLALINGTAPAIMSPPEDLDFMKVFDTSAKLAVRYGPDDSQAQYTVNDGFTGIGGASATTLRLHALRRDIPSMSDVVFTVNVPFYAGGTMTNVPQGGTSQTVHTDRGDFNSPAVYRNGFVWAVHTIRHVVNEDQSYVRWYKIQMNGWPQSGTNPSTPVEWGELALPSGYSGYYPSIAVDSLNNALITFEVSGFSKFISMWQAYKWSGDSQFRTPVEVKAGLAPFVHPTNNGWGDFTGSNPDPIAPGIFWGHGQVSDGSSGPTTLWKTWVSRRVLGCGLDIDGDGATNAMDLGAFLGLYAQGRPESDYKADGIIDASDMNALVTDLNGP